MDAICGTPPSSAMWPKGQLSWSDCDHSRVHDCRLVMIGLLPQKAGRPQPICGNQALQKSQPICIKWMRPTSGAENIERLKSSSVDFQKILTIEMVSLDAKLSQS